MKQLFPLAALLIAALPLSSCQSTEDFFLKTPGVLASEISESPQEFEAKADPRLNSTRYSLAAFSQRAAQIWHELVECNGGDAELARKKYFKTKDLWGRHPDWLL